MIFLLVLIVKAIAHLILKQSWLKYLVKKTKKYMTFVLENKEYEITITRDNYIFYLHF